MAVTCQVSDESMYTGSEESIEDSDCKKLAAVNQELYKMWQKNKEENESLKIQLEEFKKKLKFSQDKLKDVSEKVSQASLVHEAQRKEKEEVVAKLVEMEKELKALAISEQITDKSLYRLKMENCNLEEENKSLVRVVSKLAR